MMGVFDIKSGTKNAAIDLQIAAYAELARNGTAEDLSFDREHHIFSITSTGERLPSVTQVLASEGLSPDYSWVAPWYALRGTYVHKATELSDNGKLDESTVDEEIKPYLAAYQKFRKEWGREIVEVEFMAWSKTYRYAGVIDRVITGTKNYILFLRKDGTYRFEESRNQRANLNVFLSALNVLRWKETNLKEG